MSVVTIPVVGVSRRDAQLADHLAAVLAHPAGPAGGLPLALAESRPADSADALRALATIYDLHLGPIEELGRAVAWQHEPAIAALRGGLESTFERSLDVWGDAVLAELDPAVLSDPVATVRALAAVDRVPPIYDWVAEWATWDELVEFITLEGGPDDSFDDLVALCQVGLPSEAKLELARNYWDELGNGGSEAVHRALFSRLVDALGIGPVSRRTMTEPALTRAVVGGFLATNRRLQPEMVGALGMIELQAGPRCRRIVRALERLDAPPDAVPFYEEHAIADPRHGKDWLDHAIASLSERGWGPGIVRGAAWRVAVNRRFFTELDQIVRGTGSKLD
ncbi:MAG: hypothetical protein NVSMB12_11770 [Acidimicrobiales bacterium]